ncbi:MAG: hypothetical protein ACTS73_06445 [Arsenophonus sp. NEOnobi-MAG3]
MKTSTIQVESTKPDISYDPFHELIYNAPRQLIATVVETELEAMLRQDSE